MKASRSFRVAVLTVVFAILMAGAALADTLLGSNDVVLLDSEDVTLVTPTRLSLVREGTADLKINLTADDGNINCTHAIAKRTATTKRDWVLSADGTLGFKADGTEYVNPPVAAAFNCNQNFSGGSGVAQTITLNVKVIAETTAPLGATTSTITFGKTGTPLIMIGEQINRRGVDTGGAVPGEGNFTNPTLPIAVSPRPAADLSATGGDAQVALEWTKSLDQTTGIDYQIQRKETTSGTFADLTNPYQAGTQVTGEGNEDKLTYTDATVSNGTEYCYQIRARFTQGANHFFSSWIPVTGNVCATPEQATAAYSSTFLAPVDGNGVINIVKQGRTVPVKLEVLLDDVEQKVGSVTFLRRSASDCGSKTNAELVDEFASTNNTGSSFRFVTEGSEDFWQFNLNTKSLAVGCFVFDIRHDDNHVASFTLNVTK